MITEKRLKELQKHVAEVHRAGLPELDTDGFRELTTDFLKVLQELSRVYYKVGIIYTASRDVMDELRSPV